MAPVDGVAERETSSDQGSVASVGGRADEVGAGREAVRDAAARGAPARRRRRMRLRTTAPPDGLADRERHPRAASGRLRRGASQVTDERAAAGAPAAPAERLEGAPIGDAPELGRGAATVGRVGGHGGHRMGRGSGRQALAPLGPAGPEHGLPGAVGHAVAEAVALGAAAVVGLVGALHGVLLVCRATVARQR